MENKDDDYEIAPELQEITERQVGILDQENTNGEGWEYYCNGQVIRAAVFGNRISGTIREYLEEFNVEIRVDEHEIMTSCTCGSRDGVCKHTIALLYSWINDQKDFINVGDQIRKLQRMEKQDLIEALERIIRYDPINIRFLKNYQDYDEDFNVEGLLA